MYNSKKNSGDMEPSQIPLRKPNAYENDKDAGNKLTDYKMICELGRGSYGVVNRVLSLVNGNEYVLKKINMKHVKLNHQKEALKEAQILKKVRHSNIIKYYTSFVEDDYLYIIMEYAESGDLAALIKSHKEKRKPFTEKQVWDFAWELCQALEYLHNNNIIHRDIKTLNVFLSKDGHIKLGDLGVSKIVSSAAALQGTRVGTPLYLSPELVKQLPYDFKVDIWALGCVLYHLVALEAPFTGDNLISLGYNIVHKSPKPLPNTYSSKLTGLIMKFLEKSPTARPKLSEIWGYFPSKYRGGKDEANENSQPNANKVEYHNKSAAQLLKIDDKDLVKSKEEKPLTHWAIQEKKLGQLPPPTRPQTASYSQAAYRNGQIEDKINKANLGSQLSPEKINILSQPNEKNRAASPVRQTPGIVAHSLADMNAVVGENDHQNRQKRASLQVNYEKKGQNAEKKQENENIIGNKPKTIQAATPVTNEPTPTAKQGRDFDHPIRISKEDPSAIGEEKILEKKVNAYRQSPTIDALKSNNSQTEQQNKGSKESGRNKEEANPQKEQGQEGNEGQAAGYQHRNFNSQGPIQRPLTADARKIMMNPLISSASPRFKINNRLSQMPSLQTNLSKLGNDLRPNMFSRPQTAQIKPKKNNISDSKDSKKEDDDSLESIEVLEDLKKKSHSQNGAAGIRIRPVSAHILKTMQNQLGQSTEIKNINKENKNTISVIEKGENLKTETSKPTTTEGLKDEVDRDDKGNPKSRTASVERPKSALIGRLAPKAVQLQKDQGSVVGRNHPAFEAYIKPGYDWAFGKNQGSAAGSVEKEKDRVAKFFLAPDKLGVSKQEDVLKEECEDLEVFDDDDRRSTYKDFLKRSSSNNNSMRFEILGKSMMKSSVEVTKKTESEDDSKGIKRQGLVRPTTAVAASKKKLTIHDLM